MALQPYCLTALRRLCLIRVGESISRIGMAGVHVKGSVHMIDAEYQGVRGVLGTYVVRGERTAVIDPGPMASIPGIIEGLRRLGVERGSLAYVAPTHIHLDHAGGSWRLLELFPEARLYVHPRGAPHMVEPSRLEAAARQLLGDMVDSYGEIKGVPAGRVMESRDGEVLDLGGVTVQAVWTPGHSSHHQSYLVPEDGVAMLGDAGGLYSAESEMIVPTTPPPFNPPKAVESLERLIALGPELVCYGHFGFAGEGVEKLEAYKRQILLWSRIVEEGLKEGLGLEELYGRIRAEDPMARRAGGFSADWLEGVLRVSLMGFVEYFKWVERSRPSD